MKTRQTIQGAVVAALLSAAAAINSVTAEELPESARPVPQGTTGGHWYDRHLAKVAEAQAGGADVVFVGDSLTEFWETNGSDQWKKHFDTGAFKSMNLGFAGDRTEHVLWRLDNGELDGFAAKAVILEIGTNNSDAWGGGRTWEQINPTNTFVGVKAIIAKMREKQPSAKLIVHAIFPREWNPSSECRKRNEEVNALVKDYISTSGVANVVWCNFNDKLRAPAVQYPTGSDLAQTGNYLNDGPIHLSDRGYEVWGQAVLPLIADYTLE